jgi:hypothetical protein
VLRAATVAVALDERLDALTTRTRARPSAVSSVRSRGQVDDAAVDVGGAMSASRTKRRAAPRRRRSSQADAPSVSWLSCA